MSEWAARVEWQTAEPYSLDAVDRLMDHLAGYRAAVGRELTPAEPETWAAHITVEANTLRQAIAAALEVVERVSGEKATAVEVLDADAHGVRVDQPSIPDLVGYAEIGEILGVSRQRAAQIARDHARFPVAVVETKAGPLRVRSQVEGWASTWQRKNGRPKATADA